jgi:formate/nitrite transporter
MENYLSPEKIKEYTVETGVKKAENSFKKSFLLSFMGGMFISLAAIGSLIASCTIDNYSISSLVAGLVFAAGLIMVIVAGGDLFTGNVLLILAVLQKRITALKMAKNLAVTFFGNLMGALFIVFLIQGSGVLNSGNGIVGQKLILKAVHKLEYPFIQAFMLGILCNLLVSLAVWMMYSAKDTGGKVLACLFPIVLFIVGGYEHIVANMYYIPAGLVAAMSGKYELLSVIPSDVLSSFTLGGILSNFIPVTLGNLVGGLVIGGVYANIFKSKSHAGEVINKIKISA